MPQRVFRFVVAIIVTASMLASVSPGADSAQAAPVSYVEGTDPAAVLFNPASVVRIDMEIPDATWDQIQADIYSTTYRRAYLTIT
ncbi:MAG: hypothetical protein RJA31_1141, partial [Actinomycetota bacterium]